MSLTELLKFYKDNGGEIFGRPPLWRIPGENLINERYSAKPLEKYLAQKLDDVPLSAIKAVDLLVPSYAIQLSRPRENGETRAPMFFRSWRARGEDLQKGQKADEYDFLLRDVARATSAAPTYFEPAAIRTKNGETFGMVDGGVFANNPAMCALVEAYRRYGGPPDCKYLIVSLGTGFLQRPVPLEEAKGWGIIGWTRPLLSILMDGNADTVTFEAQQVLPDGFHRFDIPLGVKRTDRHAVNDDFDDASPENITALFEKADDLISAEASRIAKVAELLKAPKWHPALVS
jgi:hypothetical protein